MYWQFGIWILKRLEESPRLGLFYTNSHAYALPEIQPLSHALKPYVSTLRWYS